MDKKLLFIWIALTFLVSCQDKKKEEAINSVKQWMGKEILFPNRVGGK